ncbi:hypothetical protein [Methylobacterium sp. WL120]|uniref:hypothetical protein n=1 Tax=Methylobacterium sp. WL120 TaxID=2603887 RepID=UPI0011C92DF0|nr:hypothetical protein [Methylobacterium sp. WL120]TXM68189.1 hypothetical protein FV229_08435 [Methylobacterium sp. WL120]
MTRTLIVPLVAILSLAACSEKPVAGTVSKNIIACSMLQDFRDLKTMHNRGEEGDFQRTGANKMASGACKRYLAGTDVLIDQEKTVDNSHYACFRVEEEKACYWSELL